MGDVAGFLISGWDWFTDKLLAQLVALLVGAVVVQRFYVRQSHKAALIDYLVARLCEGNGVRSVTFTFRFWHGTGHR